ncbi:MAG: nucleoside triphosphate pyrophosphohydrolase [Candidatus Heteroscillospira sp.]|jgi:tetrapyrrole methylase family protein/MazG family protein
MVDFVRKECYDIEDFRKIIALLRSPGGCPWDREQDHASIRRNLLEEACEVCEAIDEQSVPHLREELGDLMMQVIFHARIEEEKGNFDLNDVADEACKKLILRHPHVFGDVKVSSTGEVLDNWDAIKRVEKSQRTTADAMDSVAKTLPALWRADKIQSKAAKAGFDWKNVSEALAKLREEVAELEEAVKNGEKTEIDEELGDVLFAAVKVSRFTGTDSEMALHASCGKFNRRFRYVEDSAAAAGKNTGDCSLEELIELYNQAKKQEKSV